MTGPDADALSASYAEGAKAERARLSSLADASLRAKADDVAAHIWTDVLRARGDYAGWFEDKAAAAGLILAALSATCAEALKAERRRPKWMTLSEGALDVINERLRQIYGEGFEGQHDDTKTRRGDLVRAAALIIAEIDRLDRLAERTRGAAS